MYFLTIFWFFSCLFTHSHTNTLCFWILNSTRVRFFTKINSEINNTRENSKWTIHSDLLGKPKRELRFHYPERSTRWDHTIQHSSSQSVSATQGSWRQTSILYGVALTHTLSLCLSLSHNPLFSTLYVCPRCIYTHTSYGLFTSVSPTTNHYYYYL